MTVKRILPMAVVAMLFASCSNDELSDVSVVDTMTDTPIRVNAGVADMTTRAGMTTGDLVDLGLHIENEANSKYSFSNIEFEKDANGDFVLVGSTIPLWQNETQKIIVQAYSPYNAAWTDLYAKYDIEVKTSQNVEDNVKASDLLWAKAEVDPAATVQYGDIKYNNGTLDITLEHIFSKLTVNIRFGDEFPNMMIAKDGLSIEGLNTKGNIILYDGSVGHTPNTVAAITAYKNQTATTGYDETFEAILIPQRSPFSVKIALYGGRTFQWEHDSNYMFVPGRNYTLNLVVGKDKVELDGSGITISNWDDGQGGDLETE